MTLLVALLAGIFPVYPPGGYTGKIPIAGKYTIYFPGGAFDLRGYYGTKRPNVKKNSTNFSHWDPPRVLLLFFS